MSSCSASCRSGRARARAACRGGARDWPIWLRTCVSFSLRHRLLDLLAALVGLWRPRPACGTAAPRGSCLPRASATSSGRRSWRSACSAALQHVDRVRRAERLREHVADAAELEHGAHAAAGDDAGTGRGRAAAARGPRRTGRAISCVIVCPVLRHGEQVLLRVVDGLRDRERHLARLAVADADAVDLVADHDERREREPPAALDDLGDAVDLDHALLELAGLLQRRLPLEAQSSFARAVGERLDASVVQVAAAVEDDATRRRPSSPPRRARLPTSAACSVLSPLNDFGRLEPASRRRACCPASSSISCAKMPRFERNTTRRGRSAVPRDLAAHAAVTAQARLAYVSDRAHALFPTFRRTCSPS